jgi:hypothetical protein
MRSNEQYFKHFITNVFAIGKDVDLCDKVKTLHNNLWKENDTFVTDHDLKTRVSRTMSSSTCIECMLDIPS